MSDADKKKAALAAIDAADLSNESKAAFKEQVCPTPGMKAGILGGFLSTLLADLQAGKGSIIINLLQQIKTIFEPTPAA